MARFKRHHKKRHVFGKRKEAAIKAIAMGPVETKKWYSDIYGLVSPNPAVQYTATLQNIFYDLPKGAAGDTEQTVIGNKFDCRGVKIKVTNTSTLNTEIIWRYTVFSSNDGLVGSSPIQILGNNYNIYEVDTAPQAQVRQNFNTQKLNVLESKTGSVKKMYSEQIAEETYTTLWVPIKGIKTSTEEEGGSTTEVTYLKGKQYYFLVEAYIVGASAPVNWGALGVYWTVCVYFKDP